jgi:hypothetical protein
MWLFELVKLLMLAVVSVDVTSEVDVGKGVGVGM